MPVPLTGLGDTVGVWAHWSLQGFVEAVTGCKRNLECSKLPLWKRERQHVLGKQGACVHLCPCVHFLWYLLTEQWWKGRGLKMVLLVCCQGGWSTSVALPLNCCPGLSWTWVSKGGKFSCLPPYSLHFLDAFTLFPISFSVLLLSKQIKIEFLL